MPITLPPLPRRRFLAGSLAAGAGVLLPGRLQADDGPTDPDRFVLMADTHIAGDRNAVVRNANMFGHLKQAGEEICALTRRPQAALINGDCAYLSGQSEDYEVLAELLVPLREAGTAVHLALGNHDHRERFWEAISGPAEEDRPIADRHITVIESRHANWFLLDSLHATNHIPGTLGEEQLKWLASALSARQDKPALVLVHHNPDVRQNITGLTDTKPFLEVLREHRQVKAYFFGHTHHWNVDRNEEGIHFVNLPPVAYVFGGGEPSGWVDLRLTATGAALQLNCLDKGHPQHGRKVELKWRT